MFQKCPEVGGRQPDVGQRVKELHAHVGTSERDPPRRHVMRESELQPTLAEAVGNNGIEVIIPPFRKDTYSGFYGAGSNKEDLSSQGNVSDDGWETPNED